MEHDATLLDIIMPLCISPLVSQKSWRSASVVRCVCVRLIVRLSDDSRTVRSIRLHVYCVPTREKSLLNNPVSPLHLE